MSWPHGCGPVPPVSTPMRPRELLIGHRTWLYRTDLTARFVDVRADAELFGDGPMAFIDWPGAIAALDRGGLPCSSSEAAILRIAAALGGGTGGVPVDLRAVLGGLDWHNAGLVAVAILHANGTPDLTVTVPEPHPYPPGIRVLGADGNVIQEGDDPR